MNFCKYADQFNCVDAVHYVTHTQLYARGYGMLRDVTIVLVDGSKTVDATSLYSDKPVYSRASVVLLPRNYRIPDFGTLKIGGPLSRPQHRDIMKNALTTFTVNEPILSMRTQQLYLEGSKHDDDLVVAFKSFINRLTDNSIKEELFDVNMDLPEYGVMDGKLFIVNQDDMNINRMMLYEIITLNGKSTESLAIYYFSEDIMNMKEHILSKYILIADGAIKTNVTLNVNRGIEVDNDTVIAVPLKSTNYIKYRVSDVMKLFSRKSIVEQYIGCRK